MITLNDVEIEMTNFPNGETCLNIDNSILRDGNNVDVVVFKYREDGDLLKLLFVKRWMDGYNSTSLLVMTYMPYSRLDREECNSVFTLKHVGEYIDFLGFKEVVVVEAHSDVTCAVMKNASSIDFTEMLFKNALSTGDIDFDDAEDFVCYPDATAHKRYGKMGNYKALVGMKDRDFETGWINNLDIFVPGGYSVEGKNVVIVDDLCSKGGTFILTAEELRKLGAKNVYLVVAHCEETILDGKILTTDLIDTVFTSNSIISKEKVASFPKMCVSNLEDII